MPYVPTKEILGDAHAKVYGVGAFNINDLEFLQAVIGAGAEENSPVLIEVSEGAIKYAGYGQVQRGADTLYAMVKQYADSVKIPVALHLDHGKEFKYVMACIKAGFGSVMIDASALPYEENLKETLRIVEIAHAVGVSVEAELGTLKGIEDNVEAAESILVDPVQAEDFVKRTRVDYLAPAIGTSHGAFKFKGEAKLDLQRLKRVKELTGIPLVLHGASSVPEEMVDLANRYGGKIEGAKGVPFEVLKECVEAGINKVNTDTDLRITFIAVLRKVLIEKPGEIDPRKLFGPAIEAVKEIVKARMRVLGSSGRA
ncbi:MAG TPA: class II fructose-1,6-bisphosphate aldolase [Thermotogota bacterium]|mgnify:FL=1|nr:class II fructose-1,6-bisphosphate aldolase [Thermotogota bacterium]HNR63236.1 class II fructose-1,6-bisphosphate aldolase [Thermotogota bacterium]HNT96303.1 class II fructose-1,6-bisphosphate aldolase [Thermotogota bacterium]HOZ12136.1 class II fructose-1,6-bisphosphate aldolase [Thermotogota bacterium]HPH09925.1 class II fructose-1,6-bisphosphate aldolase [Thermotogota bacterium]